MILFVCTSAFSSLLHSTTLSCFSHKFHYYLQKLCRSPLFYEKCLVFSKA